jgi:hypothetical protein
MVIRNAKLRMIGLPVGSWDDEVDPGRVIKEVIGDCQTFFEDDALQPRPSSKKRKKVVEGFQNSVLEPSRSSKRLRGVTERLLGHAKGRVDEFEAQLQAQHQLKNGRGLSISKIRQKEIGQVIASNSQPQKQPRGRPRKEIFEA